MVSLPQWAPGCPACTHLAHACTPCLHAMGVPRCTGRRRAARAGEQRPPGHPAAAPAPRPQQSLPGCNPGLPVARRRPTPEQRAHSTAIRGGGAVHCPASTRAAASNSRDTHCCTPCAPSFPLFGYIRLPCLRFPVSLLTHPLPCPPAPSLPAFRPQAPPRWTRSRGGPLRPLSWRGWGPRRRRGPASPPRSASVWRASRRSATSARCRRASQVGGGAEPAAGGAGAAVCGAAGSGAAQRPAP